MTSTRFFRIVWRINGVLVLLAFLAIGVGMLIGAVAALGHHGSDAGHVAAAAGGEAEQLVFGEVQPVEGTPYVLLPLQTSAESGDSFSSGSGVHSEARNLLFYDTASGRTRWLRPDHKAVVAAHVLLRERDDEKGPVRWIRYEIEEPVSGKEDPRRHIAVSGPGGDDTTVVLRDVGEVLGWSGVRNGRAVVFFRDGKQTWAAEIDLGERKVGRKTALPGS